MTESAPPSVKLQILATEHWSLLASRSLAWTEVFSRASMFLTVLTGSVVALALASQASGFGRQFVLFALAILPLVYYLGVMTFIRLGTANYHDARCVIGMNRIRSAYLEMAPELEKYFVMSPHDDVPGVQITMAIEPRRFRFVHVISSSPSIVIVLTSMVGGVIAAMLGGLAGWPTTVSATCGLLAFALSMGWMLRTASRRIVHAQTSYQPINPSPTE